MPKNRKAAEKYIAESIDKLLGDGSNKKIYEDLFATMNDKQFDEFMKKLEDGTYSLPVVSPNFGTAKLSVERNLALAEEWGHNFFERVWMKGEGDSPTYLSNVPYLIVQLPVCRQAQLLEKKVSIPEDNNSIDDLTGQPTGRSKGSKLSYPETQILAALNLDESLTEFLKYRGGDVKGFDAMNAAISKTGSVSLRSIDALGTTVTSTETLSAFLTSMHLSNTLLKK